jgi:hypothetical protein
MQQLEVFEEERDRWRWAYSNGNGLRLLSNVAFEDRIEAERAASAAYPDLAVGEDAPESDDELTRRLIVALLIAVLALLGVAFFAKRRSEGETSES